MKNLVALMAALALTSQASASVLTEDFTDVPGWESNWFGTQSNAKNYYGVKGLGNATRSSNLDGLWIDDNDGVSHESDLTIVFNDVFAASLTSFSLDLASYINDTNIVFFDALWAILLGADANKTTNSASFLVGQALLGDYHRTPYNRRLFISSTC
jgi:hypothetical protein